MDDRKMDVGSGLLAFGLGVIAGGIVALLLAPASGRETRRRIGGLASRLGDRAKDGMDQAKQFVDEQGEVLKGALEEGRQRFRHEAGTRAVGNDITRGA